MNSNGKRSCIMNILDVKATDDERHSATASSIWFAFLSGNDPLALERNVPETAAKVRIMQSKHFPIFYLMFNGENVGFVTPREILYALGEGRISFDKYSDMVGLTNVLTKTLATSDGIRKAGKIVAAIGGVVAAVGLLASGFSIANHRHSK